MTPWLAAPELDAPSGLASTVVAAEDAALELVLPLELAEVELAIAPLLPTVDEARLLPADFEALAELAGAVEELDAAIAPFFVPNPTWSLS